MYRAPSDRSILRMDLGIIVAVAMLVVWAVATFTTEAPGWVHALLTAGVFLLIWRIVVRGTSRPHAAAPDAGTTATATATPAGTTTAKKSRKR